MTSLLSKGLLSFILGITALHAANTRPIWSSITINQELQARQEKQNQQIANKLNEVMLYISKNDLKAASAVLTLVKAKTQTRNDHIHFIDAYLDFRLGRFDSALRILQKITSSQSNINLKKCSLWLKIAWDTNRWQEVSKAFSSCESTLAHYSTDELFYSKVLLNFSTNIITENNISPSPFFYYYSPDYAKIEQWISLLIKMNLESVAIKHLLRIPNESLNTGNVKLLTAMAVWNAQNTEYALSLMDTIPEQQKQDWNYLRLITSIALSKNNWQLAWDSNNRVLDKNPNLLSSRALDLLLGWKMNLTDLIKVKHLQNPQLLEKDPELAPIAAGMLYMKGLKQEAQNLLQNSVPTTKDKPEHHLGYWIVKQWISLRNNQMSIFMTDAINSCQKQVSFGCWLLLSGETNNNLDKTQIFPYDSVGEYFRENL
jgi:hypothetical protein